MPRHSSLLLKGFGVPAEHVLFSTTSSQNFEGACGLEAVDVTINQVCQRHLPHRYVMFRSDWQLDPAFCAVADDGAAADPVATGELGWQEM